MSIQFLCVSCGQPVEVDDQWSRQLVECPFCHDTITAPAMSTYDPARARAEVPTARPASEAPDHMYPPPHAAVPTRQRNVLAFVALALACLALVGLLASMAVMNQKFKALGLDDMSPEELRKMLQDPGPELQSALVPAAVGVFGSGGMWVAAVICGLVAVFRPVNRGPAIAALVIAGVTFLLMFVQRLMPGA